jgi:hypothetical protein
MAGITSPKRRCLHRRAASQSTTRGVRRQPTAAFSRTLRLFTPQAGDNLPEMLHPQERIQAIADMLALRREFPKLDMRSK